MWILSSIEDALNSLLSALNEYSIAKEVNVLDSLHMFSAKKYFSKINLPQYPKATMDGYAVMSSDCSNASLNNPILLKVLSHVIKSGEKKDFSIKSGECLKIETGGFLPKNADAVVPIEDVILSGSYIEITTTIGKYENVSLPGEELKEGDIIIEEGDIIRPWHVSTLYVSEYEKILVKKLTASIIYTGDEFNNTTLKPYTNYLVKGWLEEHGFTIDKIVHSKDDSSEVKNKVLELLGNHTFVIVLGGSSKGDYDTVFNGLQGISEKYVRGIRMKPGKTTSIYVIDGKPVVSISGLPAAALSSLELIVRPLLSRWLKLKFSPLPRVKAILNRRVTSKLGYVSFTRVRVFWKDNKLYAEPLVGGGSGSLRSLVLGNGYIVIPEEDEGYDKGEVVEVVLYGSIKEDL